MISVLKKHTKEFFFLFFPPVCPGCGRLLTETENRICLHCESNLAYLNYRKGDETPMEKLFWGQVRVEQASAFVEYIQGGIAQKLIHELKYKGNYEIGKELGLRFGQQLMRDRFFSSIDFIIPVPLHFTRLMKRGYNQSDMIAEGMSRAMKIPVSKKNLVRIKANKTQTKKSKAERAENVKNIFRLKKSHPYNGKHVLLVDDVVTTGSTLIECATALQEHDNIKVSIATIGKA